MFVRATNCGMRLQIGAIVGLAIAGLLAVGSIHLVGKTREDAALARADATVTLADRVQRIEIGLLQMRRAEKNFLMRLDATQVTQHGETRRVVDGDLEALRRELAAAGRTDLAVTVDTVAKGFVDYAAAFARLVENRRRLGLDPDSGLEGELRRGAHDIEKAVADLPDPRAQVLLLQMRRHEKDFMLRHDDKYATEFDKRVGELRNLVMGLDVLLMTRVGLDRSLNNYSRGFAAWVEGDHGWRAAEESMMAVHRVLEPALDGLGKEIDGLNATAKAEAAAAVRSTERFSLAAFATIVLVLGVVAGVIGRTIARQIGAMTETMTRLASGDLEVEVAGTERSNEMGRMARAVAVFRDTARERRRLEEIQADEKRRAEAERRRAMAEIAGDFERRIGGVVTTVSSAATELESAAQTLSSSAEEVSAQSTAVAGASEEAAANVQSVAAATEELSATVQEVGRQVATSSEIAAKATSEAETTRSQVGDLSAAADRIGSIVQLIQEIAGKTNLLALNATIEAARAGEAGRGFAIVAQEVKGLAAQTAHATAEIGAQVQAIQGATQQAADAMSSIGKTIAEMNTISGSIAAAVAQQDATTREIARSLGQASEGAASVSANISGVSCAAESSSAASTQVLSSAGELSRQAEGLRSAVGRFLDDVRAA